MSKSEKTKADASKSKNTEGSGDNAELSAEELEAVSGGVVTIGNLQGGALSAVKQAQMTPTVGVDLGLPIKGSDLM